MKIIFFLVILAALISCGEKTGTRISNGWTLEPFIKVDSANPVLLPDSSSSFFCPVRNETVKWEVKDVFNPAALVRHDTLFLLYRAEDSVGKYAGTSRIGLAWSTDGLHFTRHPVPVLNPDNDSSKMYEWEGGCEDPRIVEDSSGTYYMTYTAYDGDKARLLIASSKDLYHWSKHGPVFKDYKNGLLLNSWSKSGSIVCKYENGKAIAVKIDGKYQMYWGDTDIFLAVSDDLINWSPLVDLDGNSMPVFGPRIKKFDSDLVEPGPPAMLTDKGILLIYNSRNKSANGDTTLDAGTYTASQILLDKNNPSHVLDRMDRYFLKPDKSYEITGQVNRVCFVEGLAHYKEKWFLYYGTADSKIAVAIRQ